MPRRPGSQYSFAVILRTLAADLARRVGKHRSDGQLPVEDQSLRPLAGKRNERHISEPRQLANL